MSAMNVRRNIETLDDVNFNEKTRFYTAMHLLVRKDNKDWWNLCAIHGGVNKPNPDVYVDLKGLAERYAGECTKFGLTDQAADASTSENFCPHGNALFVIWHRPYVLAFETLLQKYDPGTEEEKAGRPIAAHYWKWEDGDYPNLKPPEDAPNTYGTSDPLPEFLKTPVVDIFVFDAAKNRSLQRTANPFLSGPSCQFPEQDTIIREYQWGFLRANSSGVTVKTQVENALAQTDYNQFSTTNGSDNSLEQPHNFLHVGIGGRTPLLQYPKDPDNDNPGDMNTLFSTYDPIFWVHHANVERQHYIWLLQYYTEHDQQYPDDLVNAANKQDPTSHNLMSMNLFPFPSLDRFTYENLPWVVKSDTFPTFQAGTVKSWIPLDDLPYTYDEIDMQSEVQLPLVAAVTTAIRRKFAARLFPAMTKIIQRVRKAALVLRKKGYIYRIQLFGANLRGVGGLQVTVKIDDEKEIHLTEKHFLFVSAQKVCLVCDRRNLVVTWEVDMHKLGLKGKSIELVSAIWQTGHHKTPLDLSELTIKMEQLGEFLSSTVSAPVVAASSSSSSNAVVAEEDAAKKKRGPGAILKAVLPAAKIARKK